MTNENEIVQRLAAGEILTKNDLQTALDAIVKAAQTQGESDAACFARLVKAQDQRISKICEAMDAATVADEIRKASKQQRATKARLQKSANDMLDDLVARRCRADESTQAAYARLAKDKDASFTALYEHLRDVSRDL